MWPIIREALSSVVYNCWSFQSYFSPWASYVKSRKNYGSFIFVGKEPKEGERKIYLYIEGKPITFY